LSPDFDVTDWGGPVPGDAGSPGRTEGATETKRVMRPLMGHKTGSFPNGSPLQYPSHPHDAEAGRPGNSGGA